MTFKSYALKKSNGQISSKNLRPNHILNMVILLKKPVDFYYQHIICWRTEISCKRFIKKEVTTISIQGFNNEKS